MQQERYYVPSEPENERDRIKTYLFYEGLYFGKNKQEFAFKQSPHSTAIYMVNNFTRLLSEFYSDLLFSEPPEFIHESEQEAVDEILKNTKLHTTNLQSAVSNAYRGDAVYKVWRDEEGMVHIDDIAAMMYFPEFKQGQLNEIEYTTLAWKFKSYDKTYLRKEIHYKDHIENELYLIADDYKGKFYTGNKLIPVSFSNVGMEGIEEYQETGIDESLIVHVPNYRISNYHYGISDIESLESMLEAADYRMTQLANILDKHADPKLAVPKGVLDKHGMVRSGAFNMFEVAGAGTGLTKPEYITWDPKLDYVFKEIDLIAERIALFGRFPMGLMKERDKVSAPEAAKALKLKFLMALKKAERKRVYYDAGLKKVFEIAGKLMNKDLTGLQINWNDGLPEDEKEQLEILQLKKTIGVQSDESNAREYLLKQGKQVEEVDQEIERLNNERRAQTEPTGRPPIVELPPITE